MTLTHGIAMPCDTVTHRDLDTWPLYFFFKKLKKIKKSKKKQKKTQTDMWHVD